ncbi:hypothetical protein ACFL6S_32305, partial [Candidatus Poribacteria bacterium]
DGKLKVNSGTLGNRFAEGAKVGFVASGGRVVLAEDDSGVKLNDQRQYEFELPEAVWAALPKDGPVSGMIMDTEDHLELLHVRVQEHNPDVLGPRIIDEIQESPGAARTIVRHIAKGFEYGDLTSEKLQELEDLICSKPFSYDPLRELSAGADWVSWKMRNEILHQPAPDDESLRQKLVDEIFTGQMENGSWGDSVMKTAYGVLRALSVQVPVDDSRIRQAAQWLLNWAQPVGRPGMWMLSDKHRQEWDAIKNGETRTDDGQYTIGFDDENCDFVRAEEQQQVIATCARHFTGLCDSMLHPSATVADTLCRCGYADHPRVRDYANSMLQLGGMFGYFCACWGINAFDEEVKYMEGKTPDFSQRTDENGIALKAVPYGYARDRDDLRVLARNPNYPGIHRPDLADTNGWWLYEWRDIGVADHFALVGTYWQNADCWAKTNRALSQFPTWPGSIAEFFSLFQLHLYQTSLGEWNQGYPAGIFRWLAEVTRIARAEHNFESSTALRFAKTIMLKAIPWLREHQEENGLWDHSTLPRHSGGENRKPPSSRLVTYHIVSALNEFNLLSKLLPRI